MQINQNDLDGLKDRMAKGELTADQANVEKVRLQRVLLATSCIVAPVRKALNAAVKRGELGHMKKDGYMPEAYFHPTFDYLARQERNNAAQATLRALAGVIARPLECMDES